jgi:biotin carboxylase
MSALIFNRKVMGGKFYAYSDWLRDLGDRLVLFTQVSRLDLDQYDRVEIVESFDKNGWTEAEAIQLHSDYNFKSIVVHSEYDLIRAARLREYLGIQGQSVKSAVAYRDKVIMKEFLRKAGVKTADFSRLDSPIDLYKFVTEKGFPVLLKPRDAGGGRYIRTLSSMSEVKSFLEQGLPQNFMVEKFVSGGMYHADGLAQNGDLAFVAVSRYYNGCLAYQRQLSVGSAVVSPANPIAKRISELLPEIMAALPSVPAMAFHAEFFHTDDDEVIVCEIASRTAGGRIMETVEMSYGVDIIKSWVRWQSGLPADIAPELKMHAGYLVVPPRNARLEKLPDRPPFSWVIDYTTGVQEGQDLNDPISNGESIATALVVGETEEQAGQRIVALDEWFQTEVRWS